MARGPRISSGPAPTTTMILIQVSICILLGTANARTLGIPTTPFSGTEGRLSLSALTTIVVDSEHAQAVNEKGETLIPPTLQEFADTFASDLKGINVDVASEQGQNATKDSIFLTIGDPSDYLDVAGRESSEGYTLSVSSTGITVTGASPLGVWWGTRTILQQAVLNNGSIPLGSATDTPGWGTRGMMLDAARHYYPPDFLVEICSYMSFFKQNTFHVHLSDNLYNNVNVYSRERSLDLYARFRLWSDAEEVAGLNKHKNESYTRDQFEEIQSSCAARGVTIIPEIEAPGHALVFVQWKPELGLTTDLSLLNISNPETIPTMKTVWSEFLPWFHSKTVHIGADEYTAEVNDYNIFVNAMADHISTAANKSIRIWGTFPPVYDDPDYINIYQNVTVQHWAFFEDNPLFDYIRNNYTVLNSDDTYYVVGKWSGSYPQRVNVTATFVGNPATRGLWYPNVFDAKNATNNPERQEPLILGHMVPLWNDYGPNSTVYSEAYYSWREGIPALADKQWGGNLTAAEFSSVLEALHPSIPGQNLDRRIPSKSSTILEYAFDGGYSTSNSSTSGIIDSSGNGYDGTTDCTKTEAGAVSIDSCSIQTPLSSKGRDYTLTLSFLLSSLDDTNNATLISGRDSTLMLTPNVTFFAGGEYFRLNSSLPIDQRLDLSIIGRGNRTFAKIDDGAEEEFLTKMGINGERFEWGPMAFEAPLQTIGGENAGWTGEVYGLQLLSVA
ncbi:beta-hexosaminidase [Corynespora cassiicola Philippines]|uniref:beta-N-acetylhexosaminidase n=1 Tax=Corynespora cassiicola Philippines TaxID=1448308 RepID=A0A2T2NI35_CORCC|nr:beta-hexosaminidase [Corynespora cassiicola Philippines]